MRLYRFLLALLGVFALLPSRNTPLKAQELSFDGTFRRINVPILMYHYVDQLPEDADEYRVDLTISPENFRAHLLYLRESGYTTISLAHLYDALMQGASLPPQPIILTFDDGYANHFLNAFPILREFGMTGTFFVITDLADQANPDYLHWSQVQEMSNAGMEIASHSKSHPDLRQRDHDFLIYQVLGSMQSVEAITGRRALAFSYPAGRYDENTLEVVDQTPIGIAVTTRNGRLHTTDAILELPRLRISGDMNTPGLRQLLGDR